MRDALGVLQISRAIVHDQIISINRFRNGTIAQRAVIHLLERGTAEAKHQQHAVSVGVVFGGRGSQVVVQVTLKRIGQPVFFKARVVVVVADFHRTIGRQKLRARIGLEAQHGFKQQRMPHPAHSLNRRTIGSAAHAWDFNLQPQQLQAGGTVFDPIVAAGQVITDTAQQVFADAPKLHVVDLLDKVIKPAGGLA